MKLLAIDIGNTNITMGIFEENSLTDVQRITSDKNASVSDYEFLIKKIIPNNNINHCAIGSVVNELTPLISKACEKVFNIKPSVIDAKCHIPITIDTDSPEKVGIDRIINAAFSAVNYELPAAVIDFGTATTIDIVSENKEFLGGIIMPGIKMQAKSLHEKTSLLPEIELNNSKSLIGKNTYECISSGILRGSAAAIDGLISQIEAESGKKMTLIATGGLCDTISKYMAHQFHDIKRNMTLEGIRMIYDLNH